MNEIDIVRDISHRFEHAGVPYMLTGSMAMNYYAQPRMTRDIDVVIAIGPEEAGRLAALFRPDYYVSEENNRLDRALHLVALMTVGGDDVHDFVRNAVLVGQRDAGERMPHLLSEFALNHLA